MTTQTLERTKLGKIGGTTVSAIVGLNPWMGRHSAYLQLRNEVSPTPDNEAMARGRRFEDSVARVFAANHPEYRVEHNRQKTEEPEEVVHPQHDYLIAHPDRLLFDETGCEILGGLEIKTSSWSNMDKWGDDGTDEVPTNYQIQCQWYAGLMGLGKWTLAVAFLDDSGKLRSYREHPIFPNKRIFDTLIERSVEFWEDHVFPGIPPEIDYEKIDQTTERWINERFSRNFMPLEQANHEEELLIENYLIAKQKAKESEEVLKVSESKLKIAIGERDGIYSSEFGKVTWKAIKDSSKVDYKGIVEKLNPEKDIINEFTKTVAGYRRFETRGLKQK